MAKKKVLLAIAFVAIAMASGGIVSVYAMNQGSAEAKDAPQTASVEAVQAEEMPFSCGIDGCVQIGEHSHGGNSGGHHHSGHH